MEIIKDHLTNILSIDKNLSKIHSDINEILIKINGNPDKKEYTQKLKISELEKEITEKNKVKRTSINTILNEIINQSGNVSVQLDNGNKYIIRRSGYLYDGGKADLDYYACYC